MHAILPLVLSIPAFYWASETGDANAFIGLIVGYAICRICELYEKSQMSHDD